MKRLLPFLLLASLLACNPSKLETPSTPQMLGKLELQIGSTPLRPQAIINPQGNVSFTGTQFSSIQDGSNRFLNATFSVTNNTTATNYTDVTLVAYVRSNNRADTAISNLQNFGGLLNTAQLDAYARATKPSNIMNSTSAVNTNLADLQLFTESEISSLQSEASSELAAGEYLLPYGYVARVTNSTTSRVIAPGTTGTLGVGIRVPNSNEPGLNDPPYRFSMTFIAYATPTNSRVSESLEEHVSSTSASNRQGTFSASQLAVLHNSPNINPANNQINTCRVRTAGSSSSPLEFLAPAVNTASGSLQSCFALGGKRITNFAGQAEARGVAITSTGQILLAGFAPTSGLFDAALARYNSDGSLDTSFGSNGTLTANLGSSSDKVSAMVLDSAGRIVVAGSVGSATQGRNFVIARFNADGTPDTSFNSTGRITADFNGFNDEALSVAIASNGDLIAAGFADTSNSSDMAVFRVSSAGVPVATFGSAGKATVDFSSAEDVANAVAVDGSTVYIAGSTFAGSTDMAIAALDSTGALQNSFDSDGRKAIDFSNDEDIANAVLVLGGEIYLAGSSFVGSDNNFAVAKLSAAGALVGAFGTAGKATFDASSNDDTANAITSDANGLLLAGTSGSDVAVVRVSSSTGAAVSTFGASGIAVLDVNAATGTDFDAGYAIATSPAGVVVAGESNNRFALLRLNP